jgi:hypothetical protein
MQAGGQNPLLIVREFPVQGACIFHDLLAESDAPWGTIDAIGFQNWLHVPTPPSCQISRLYRTHIALPLDPIVDLRG